MPTGCMLGTLLRLRTENSAVVPKMSPRYQLLFKNKTTRSCSCIAHLLRLPVLALAPGTFSVSQRSSGLARLLRAEKYMGVCACVCVSSLAVCTALTSS